MRIRLVLGSLLGAAAIHAACQMGGMDSIDTAIADDGGTGTVAVVNRDSGAPAASTSMTAPCNQTRVGSGFTYYYAAFDLPSFDPATSGPVSARTCGLQCNSTDCASRFIPGECAEAGVRSSKGKVYVYCGVEQDRYTSAKIWLR